MRYIASVFILMAVATVANAEDLRSCKAYHGSWVNISWSGKCINGMADGVGAEVYKEDFDGKSTDVVWVSKYNMGIPAQSNGYAKQYYPEHGHQVYYRRDYSSSSLKHYVIPKDVCVGDPLCLVVENYDISRFFDLAAGYSGSKSSDDVDGFVFKIASDQNGVKILETSGGPCATAEAKVYRTYARLDNVKISVERGTWDSYDHSITAESVYNGIVMFFHIYPGIDYSESLQGSKRSMGEVLQSYSSSSGEKSMAIQSNSMTECIARNHRHYILAYRDWAKANSARLK